MVATVEYRRLGDLLQNLHYPLSFSRQPSVEIPMPSHAAPTSPLTYALMLTACRGHRGRIQSTLANFLETNVCHFMHAGLLFR